MSSQPVFGRRANLVALLSMVLLVIGLVTVIWLPILFAWSGGCTGQYDLVSQPIPFSHAHHVSEIGIDCRFCHHDVLRTSFAGLPATETCINCHWQILRDAPVLKKVHESWQGDVALQWNRVYKLPDFVYFDHAVHLHKGIGCSSCHGRVDRMRVTTQSVPLTMGWCLDCHRDPTSSLRPPEELFDLEWQPTALSAPAQQQLAERYRIEPGGLTDCYVCHR